eukprot:Gregarina_sp_Poly_1__10784@NODE_829_length_6100_cov_40_875849_g600_i0_p1_GENE_NODE_829_length_6100_cov_40_875849_g600_i0NODE_829_length_6100_cov_40_875849_g600_i0_p1_ORF_typecomplete_len552_score77_30Pkinase/PF00069_25/9_6e51Pkinase_Tyr/PF07714_17/2_6e29Pkinase_fungal/PF17667_1/6_6e02Pkinase_fungal/PF17667_1/1_1e10Kdo/PF06293_14/1_4e10Kinaselike/PF14531_6/0_0044Kinaselike/PF14531_6/0_00094EcKinase/PF02958_20/0_0018WaaY/PF06176_11/0_014APH/PF01636_23/0_31APH/PF01636_23/2_1e02_NODE_829_length_6100
MSPAFEFECPFFADQSRALRRKWNARPNGQAACSPRQPPNRLFGPNAGEGEAAAPLLYSSPRNVESPSFSPLSTRATASPGTPSLPTPPLTRRGLSIQLRKRRIVSLPVGQSITQFFDFLSSINGSLPVEELFPECNVGQRALNASVKSQVRGAADAVAAKALGLKTNHRPILLMAREKSTGINCVVKVLRKSTIPPASGGERLWRELCSRLLRCPSHPNLLPFYGIFEDEKNYYLFFEQLHGGELFDFLLTESAVPEELCKHLVRQILLALEFLHGQSIVHRDVKPENLMFRFKRPANILSARTDKSGTCLLDSLPDMLAPYELVLIDFDTCRMTDLGAEDYQEWVGGRRRLVGTYGYLAPEVLVGGDYSPASDLWSVGVILYVLMTGIPPVPMGLMKNAKSSHDELKKLESKGIDFDFPPLPDFPLARDLCSRLLEFHPGQRLASATEALRHPWLVSSATLSAKYYVASPLAQLMPYTVFQWSNPQPSMTRSMLSLPPVWDPKIEQNGTISSDWSSSLTRRPETDGPGEENSTTIFTIPDTVLGRLGYL